MKTAIVLAVPRDILENANFMKYIKEAEFCSYSHNTLDLSNLLDDMKMRLMTLEKDMKEKPMTIDALKDKIDETQMETKQLKADFKEFLESVTKTVLEKAMES